MKKGLGERVASGLMQEGVMWCVVEEPEEYHAVKVWLEGELGVPVVSKSLLVDFVGDSYGSRWRREHGVEKRSAALDAGSLVDCLALTPGRDVYVAVDAADRRSKAWKEGAARAAEAGKKPVLRAEYERAAEVAEAVRGSILRRHGEYDSQVGLWMYVERLDGVALHTPVVLTGMIDALPRDAGRAIVDLKTTSQPLVSKEAINKNMAQFSYGIQAAMYCDLLAAVTGQERGFEFLFAGLDEPTRLRWVRMRGTDTEMYRLRYFAAVRLYALAWVQDDWGEAELPEMEYEPPMYEVRNEKYDVRGMKYEVGGGGEV